MSSTFTITNIPAGLRGLARVLMRRDDIDAFDAWHDHIAPAIDDLEERLAAGDDGSTFDEADFMSEHFSLEPDYFIALLNALA